MEIYAAAAESFPVTDYEEALLELNQAVQVQNPYSLFISVIATGKQDRSSFKINYKYIERDPSTLSESEKAEQ